MLTKSQIRVATWLKDAGVDVTVPVKRATILAVCHEHGMKWVPNWITHDPGRRTSKRGWYDLHDLEIKDATRIVEVQKDDGSIGEHITDAPLPKDDDADLQTRIDRGEDLMEAIRECAKTDGLLS